MKKIISLFQRDYSNGLIKNEIVPGAEWVVAGEGVATRQWDGTCCMIRDGILFKRYDVKKGKSPPDGFEPAQDPDEMTGHWPGWLKVGDGPEDQYHREALNRGHAISDPLIGAGMIMSPIPFEDWTYELVGIKIQGNPENVIEGHWLIPHGKYLLSAPRDFEGIKEYLSAAGIEGIVWHHPDGRMVKIKRRDFFRKGV